MNAVQMKK